MVNIILFVLVMVVAASAGISFQAILGSPCFYHWRTLAGSFFVVLLIYYSISMGTHPVADPVELLDPWVVYGSLVTAVVSGWVYVLIHPYKDKPDED